MAKTAKAKTAKDTAGIPRVTLPKTQEELNKSALTLDAKAEIKVLAHYRQGHSPIVVPNRELAHYSVSVSGVPVIVNQKQYDALFGLKAENDMEKTDA